MIRALLKLFRRKRAWSPAFAEPWSPLTQVLVKLHIEQATGRKL